MRYRAPIAVIFGFVMDGVGVIKLLLSFYDWIKSNNSSGLGNWIMTNFPWLALILLIVGTGLITWGRRTKLREVNVTITPLYAVIVTGLLFAGACGWFVWDWRKGPIDWKLDEPNYPIFGMQGNDGGPPLVWQMQFSGINGSEDKIASIDGTIVSSLTNKAIPLYFQIAGNFIRSTETAGIPPKTQFTLIAPITGDNPDAARGNAIRSDHFISEYGDITLTVTFTGTGSPLVRRFKHEELTKRFDDFRNSLNRPQEPTINPKR